MTTQLFVLLLIGTVLLVYFGIALATWSRLRGTRVVTCPATHKPAAVTVDVGHAAMTALWESADLRPATCSEWPERQRCDQTCMSQIVGRGDATRLTVIARRFFNNQRCAICQDHIDPIHVTGPQPGMLNPMTHEAKAWHKIPPQDLQEAFGSQRALCAHCARAESFPG